MVRFYVHAGTMSIADVIPESVSAENETQLLGAMVHFANWIWESLRDDFDGEHEEDAIAENVLANEYEFTVDGARYSL